MGGEKWEPSLAIITFSILIKAQQHKNTEGEFIYSIGNEQAFSCDLIFQCSIHPFNYLQLHKYLSSYRLFLFDEAC